MYTIITQRSNTFHFNSNLSGLFTICMKQSSTTLLLHYYYTSTTHIWRLNWQLTCLSDWAIASKRTRRTRKICSFRTQHSFSASSCSAEALNFSALPQCFDYLYTYNIYIYINICVCVCTKDNKESQHSFIHCNKKKVWTNKRLASHRFFWWRYFDSRK